MEIELKLLLDPDDVPALRGHPLLAACASTAPSTHKLQATYFDTADLAVRASGASLRVRRIDGHWVQTFKGGDVVSSGLHSREEWESTVTSAQPDLAALRQLVDRKSPWRKLLQAPQLDGALRPVFTTRIARTKWDLVLPEGDEVECVLDQGHLEHDGDTVPISEIELELKSGDPAHLFDFALALQHDIPLQVGNRSKSERGYAMLDPLTAPAAVPAAALDLSRPMGVMQAFRAIVGNCLTQIQSNAPGVVAMQDVESLHQMRVGLRRLNSALGLFNSLRPLPDGIQQELDWLGTQLGPGRDWDVLVESTLPDVISAVPDAALGEVATAAQNEARLKHRDAAAAVDSQRYHRLLLQLARWMQDSDMDDPDRGQSQQLQAFARRVLKKNQRRLARRGNQVRGTDVRASHRLRIAVKKMRYAVEFFQSLYPARRLRQYRGRLTDLQEQLGWYNDVTVADKLLEQLQRRRPVLASSIGFTRGYLHARSRDQYKNIRKRARKLAETKPDL
ncbi:triphosphatase [Actimicrobium sp. GrIS 1.19]|uniref:CYTH and CHAD domain-containing protein n=1 Tax=Actimicrobium sp. GrIS 1.19 TaxID=3071708 RepID=UPI002E02A7F1|nr:triphosphatase [Actimicrobium sp. GrIS 1.19]